MPGQDELNPILETEHGNDPIQELGKLILPKAPPPDNTNKPAPLRPDVAAMNTANYIGQQQPGAPPGQPMSPDTLKALQDKLQPPELQQLQSTDLPQYTGFHANSPDQSQTPPGQDTQPQPQMGGGLDLINQAQQQLDKLKQQHLQGVTNFTNEASRNLNNSVLKGSSAVPLFDGNSFDNVQQRINQTNAVIAKTAEQAKQAMASGMMNDPRMYPQVEQNPNKFRTNSTENPFQNGDIGGFVHALWGQVQAAGRGLSELNKAAVSTEHAAVGTIVDDKDPRYAQQNDFAPFRGARMWADAVYKDPWKLITLPIAPIIASVEGHYGEAGNGTLGGLQYIAGLGINTVMGGATDLYNLATGHQSPPGRGPNVVQAFKGGSYDFLRRPDTEHPLSIFSPAPAPDNLQDLKRRSILYSNPVVGWAIDRLGDMGVRQFPKPFGQKAANVGLHVAEGLTGLIADVAVDPLNGVIHALNPKTYTAPIKAASEVAKAEEAAQSAERNIVGAKLYSEEEIQAMRAKAGTPIAPTSPTSELKPIPPEQQVAQIYGRQAGVQQVKVPEIPKTPTQVVSEIPKHTPGTLVDPASLVEVKRTPDELTALAIHNGDAQPGRLHALPPVRIRLLNEDENGVYSVFGNPIEQHELRANFPEHPAVGDVPLPNSLREVVPMMKQAEAIANDPSRELALRYQAAHTADQLADRLALPPAVEDPKVMSELMPSLPASQYVSSEEGLRLLKQRFAHELEYHDSATNSRELADQLAVQQKHLEENLQRIDSTPDVGRQILHENPKFVPPKAVDAPHPVAHPDTTELVNGVDLSHGSKVHELDLSKVDPIQGSARHELGVGHYLTTNWLEAREAAQASVNRNVPPIPSRIFDESGTVHDVTVDAKNTLDASVPPPQAVKDVFVQEAQAARVHPDNIKAYVKSIQDTADMALSRMWTEFDHKIAVPEHNFPEAEALNFQRRVATRLRNMGFDTIAHVGEDGHVVVNVLDHTKIRYTLPEPEVEEAIHAVEPEHTPEPEARANSAYAHLPEHIQTEIRYKENELAGLKQEIVDIESSGGTEAHKQFQKDGFEAQIEDLEEELETLRNWKPKEYDEHGNPAGESVRPSEPTPQATAEPVPSTEPKQPTPQQTTTPGGYRETTNPVLLAMSKKVESVGRVMEEATDNPGRFTKEQWSKMEAHDMSFARRLEHAGTVLRYEGEGAVKAKLYALDQLIEYENGRNYSYASEQLGVDIDAARRLAMHLIVEDLTPEQLRGDKQLMKQLYNVPPEKIQPQVKPFLDKAGYEWNGKQWKVPKEKLNTPTPEPVPEPTPEVKPEVKPPEPTPQATTPVKEPTPTQATVTPDQKATAGVYKSRAFKTTLTLNIEAKGITPENAKQYAGMLVKQLQEKEGSANLVSRYAAKIGHPDHTQRVNDVLQETLDSPEFKEMLSRQSGKSSKTVPKVTPVEEAASRYNTTQRTAGRMPDDPTVAIHAMEDGATLQARVVQQTAENYQAEAQKAVTDAQRVVNTEAELKKASKADRAAEAQRLADEARAKDETQSKHMNSEDNKWCG